MGKVDPKLLTGAFDLRRALVPAQRREQGNAHPQKAHIVRNVAPDAAEALLDTAGIGVLCNERRKGAPADIHVHAAATDISPNFHREAQAQKQHIAKAFRETLPQALARFDTQNGLVEPSFFSEMLGIQGRMDYLQQDMKVLVEQKAGKGNFPYDLFKVPRHKEEHYVQLLLYMALLRYNFRETYEANRKELHAFLLYSKYEEPLVGLGFAPDLLFRALKLRNELAHQEMELAQPDGFRVLEHLQAEDFNEKHTQSKLWEAYLNLFIIILQKQPFRRDHP